MAYSAKQLLGLILSNAGCPSKTTHQGSGPINLTFDANDGLVIRSLLLNCTSKPTTAEDFVIRHQIPGQGPEFDVLRFQQDMGEGDGVKSVVIDDPIFVSKGDRLVLEWDNSDNVSWGVILIHGRNA